MLNKLTLRAFPMKPLAVALALCSSGLSIHQAVAESCEAEALDLVGVIEDIDVETKAITVDGQTFVLSADTLMLLEGSAAIDEELTEMVGFDDEHADDQLIDDATMEDVYAGGPMVTADSNYGFVSAKSWAETVTWADEDYADDFADDVYGEWEDEFAIELEPSDDESSLELSDEDSTDAEWLTDEFATTANIEDFYVGEAVLVSASCGENGVDAAELIEKIQLDEIDYYSDLLSDEFDGEWQVDATEEGAPTAEEIEAALADEDNIYKHPDATPEMWEMFMNFVRSEKPGALVELQQD